MAFRKKTLRTMSPTARKVARLAGELSSCTTRLKNLMPLLQELDRDAQALEKAKDTTREGEYQAYMATLAFILAYRDFEGLPKDEIVNWLRRRVAETEKQYQPVIS